MKIRKIASFTVLAWMCLVSFSFLWNYSTASKEQERVALESAKTLFKYINITRLWNSQHSAVYVPVTEKTQPNPYINLSSRDIKINNELTLTQINPTYMIQQISDLALKQNGIQFHFTSLTPINPTNRPTELEVKILKEFQNGLTEKGMFITKNNQPYYFYMAPVYTDKSCFSCHPKPELLHNNIGGGISIISSSIMKSPFWELFFGHIVISIVGLFVIFLTYRKLRNAYKIIQKQASIDELTGIPNRRVFSEHIRTEFKRHQRDQQPLSVIMCDIDHFKAFNDTYGHLAGDNCLTKVAQTIQHSLKRPVDFCARYGGEEFIILLPETEQSGAKHFAETVRQEVEALNMQNDKAFHHIITISLGVATSTKNNPLASYEKLINQADQALYKAKEQGRNQVQTFK